MSNAPVLSFPALPLPSFSLCVVLQMRLSALWGKAPLGGWCSASTTAGMYQLTPKSWHLLTWFFLDTRLRGGRFLFGVLCSYLSSWWSCIQKKVLMAKRDFPYSHHWTWSLWGTLLTKSYHFKFNFLFPLASAIKSGHLLRHLLPELRLCLCPL